MLMEWRVGGLRESMVPQFVPVAGPAVRVLRADPEFVDRAHARGKRVFAWTVNERADIDFVCDLGVDTLITDRPREVLAHLSATR
jgi:glycerophosphoryl diester phosphodiesterase